MATPAQPRAADAPPTPVAALRTALKAGREALRESFLAKPDTPKLLREHARLVDTAIRGAWRESRMPAHAALVAVGGYGRGQLFPHSDVDVLILLPGDDRDGASIPAIERFLAMLWDVGVEASHAVRTIPQCAVEMKSDAT
ncbi:MAG: nucleotidyltransferase domain-containing protein, partial [Burkholderiales bacterium]|nr:nucleotidyltransferase domain-containing protein [Burkholderiales bacterium]